MRPRKVIIQRQKSDNIDLAKNNNMKLAKCNAKT